MNLDKLLETGDKCIHNEPPACAAACPVHLDVIAFVSEIEKGDFKKAYKLMEKRIPFARLIGNICDHPCESICARKDAGGSIHISDLEKAVVRYGYEPPKKTLELPKNKGHVAIVGAGMSGLTAAVDLNKKGYLVTLYEKSGRLGGRIWDYEDKGLDKGIIEQEMKIVENLGINIKYNTSIDSDGLKQLENDVDAVYLGTGVWEKDLKIDPVTFQIEDTPVFAGGRLINENDSIIASVSSGRRAAISIDRYIGKVSLTASREREGVFETLLNYNTDKEPVIAANEKNTDTYSEDEAVIESRRCMKCQCRDCINGCVHMQKFNISPYAYIRQINQNERIILGTHYANKMINSCTECGLCKEACSLDISMKDVIHDTRESMVEKGKMPQSAHDFALKDMEFSNSNQFSMVRKQPSKEASKDLFYYPVLSYSKYAKGLFQGSGKTGFLFYPGCQLSATHSEYIGEIYKYLVGTMKENYIEGDVGLYLGCCGAPADWAGKQDMMNENIQNIKKVWEENGQPTFILACSSCMSIFEKYLPEAETVSLWEIFDQYGLPQRSIKPGNRVLSIHDACATRHNANVHKSIRNILNSLSYKIVELEYTREKTKCCGYGGLVYYANRDQAEEFIKDRINESSEDLLVYCAMCKDLFTSGGKRTYHILDLIFGGNMDETAEQKMPNLSQRHANRALLKKKLLKEIWNEETESTWSEMDNLYIPEEVWKTMEERYILREDIEKVIKHALLSGERFFNPQDLSYLASQRIADVTYWVRYAEEDGNIHVKTVYSHRMEVKKE